MRCWRLEFSDGFKVSFFTLALCSLLPRHARPESSPCIHFDNYNHGYLLACFLSLAPMAKLPRWHIQRFFFSPPSEPMPALTSLACLFPFSSAADSILASGRSPGSFQLVELTVKEV